MFGLMRPESSCGQTRNQAYDDHRIHYCGTCKAIGREYGQASRLMLNFDAVFFAELLTALAGDDISLWSGAYQAVNQCWVLPQAGDLPRSLRYAGATTVFLAELKLRDQVQDNRAWAWAWKSLAKGYHTAFERAALELQTWGLDLEACRAQSQLQSHLEQKAELPAADLSAVLAHYAAPTQAITGLVLRQAASAIERPELAEILEKMGQAFGLLVYALDALEDFEKDRQKGDFNPLALLFPTQNQLDAETKTKVQTEVLRLQDQVLLALQDLPLEEAKAAQYQGRLCSNLATRLYQTQNSSANKPSARLRRRLEQARDKAKQWISPEQASFNLRLQYQLISVAIFIAPQTSELLTGNRQGVLQWTLIFTAFLGALGLGLKALLPRQPQKNQRKNRFKQFFQNLRQSKKRNDCLAQCIVSCCAAICAAICDSGACCGGSGACNNCGDNCCDGCCNSNERLIWILIGVFFIALLAGLLILLILI